jgi:hypothetical protein
MTGRAVKPGDDGAFGCPPKSKSGPKARCFAKSTLIAWVPGRSEAPPGLDGYFLAFLVFLAFFAFFAFFAFLAIASSLS